MTTNDLKSFHYLENGEIMFSMYDTIRSGKKLNAGSYKISYLDYPENRVQLKIDTDIETVKIHNFPDKQKIDDLYNSFFQEYIINKITSLGFYHKVGILLYGKEGTGKSTILKYYYNKAIIENNAIVFHFNSILSQHVIKCWDFIMNVRKIQSNPIIVLFEEFDVQIYNKNESFLKTIFDGNMSINNCIFMATTNYIDVIPDAMKNRVQINTNIYPFTIKQLPV